MGEQGQTSAWIPRVTPTSRDHRPDQGSIGNRLDALHGCGTIKNPHRRTSAGNYQRDPAQGHFHNRIRPGLCIQAEDARRSRYGAVSAWNIPKDGKEAVVRADFSGWESIDEATAAITNVIENAQNFRVAPTELNFFFTQKLGLG